MELLEFERVIPPIVFPMNKSVGAFAMQARVPCRPTGKRNHRRAVVTTCGGRAHFPFALADIAIFTAASAESTGGNPSMAIVCVVPFTSSLHA